MKETTGKWETAINSGGLCGYLLDKQVEQSTYSISLHMVHLLLYDLPSASRTGSLSRVQLSFPSFIFSRYSAHWSWKGKREQAPWMTWSVVCLLSFLNNLSQKFLSISSYLSPLIQHVMPRIAVSRRGAGIIHILRGQLSWVMLLLRFYTRKL